MKKIFAISLLIIFATGLLAYSQFAKKEIIFAALQQQLNLESPPDSIFAITLSDQKLTNGKSIKKGTKFIGKVTKIENGFTINFDTIQPPDSKIEKLQAKTNLKFKDDLTKTGVSAKIGMTIYDRTKGNVLGAIFRSQETIRPNSLILPQGYKINIEIE